MRPLLLCVVFSLLALSAATPTNGQSTTTTPPAAPAIQALLAGIVVYGDVIAGGAALTSGAWGTDYITVSHALGVRDTYAIVRDGLPFAETKPVAACSTVAHGIDVLILRAATHRFTPVVEWGDPQELKRGDELTVYARKEFAAEPSKLKFLHLNLKEWSPPTRGYGREWENTMVAEGVTRSGFSGSPWARGGKVYGLHKGRISLPGQTVMYPVAETALRVKDCLQQLRYEQLLPQN